MFCKFELIANDVHKCSVCNYEVKTSQESSKINRRCGPSNLEKAKNITKAIINHASDNAVTVSEDDEKKRRDICQGNGDIPKCEFFNNDKCGKCGCTFMSQKWKWRTSTCPIGKW